MQAEGQHVQNSRGRKAHGVFEEPKARAAIRSEAGAETAEGELRRGPDTPRGPRWNFAPRGAREGPEQKKSGSQTSLLPSLRSARSPPPAPCSLRVPPPRAPGPHARPAHRSSGLRPVAHPQQHPFPDAATAIFRSPPGTAHAWRARGRREMESAQRAEPAPTASRASGLLPPPRRLRAALRFLPSNVLPSGKCSPSAEARHETGERVLGNGVPWFRVLGRLWWRECAESGWRNS